MDLLKKKMVVNRQTVDRQLTDSNNEVLKKYAEIWRGIEIES